jgi:hypothetical protein
MRFLHAEVFMPAAKNINNFWNLGVENRACSSVDYEAGYLRAGSFSVGMGVRLGG